MPGNCRILSVVVLSLGLAFAAGAPAGEDAVAQSAPLSSNGAALSPGELAIVRVMNSVRASNGVPPLRVGRALTRAARSHSADMARRGYFDHGAFVRRLRSFGVRAQYLGENLAAGSHPLTAVEVIRMWVASPPHRQNLLDRSFRRVGVGEAGGSTRLVTADFAGG
jgi:uncharacterized protein YkwD